jgi:hypothetical protein
LGGRIHLITGKMTQKDNILQELKELNSNLAGHAQQVYSVPEGYFEGLISELLKRIKAMEAGNAGEELGHLSPYLKSAGTKMPYQIPAGYFEGLAETAIAVAKSNDDRGAKEETETISPLLGSLKKQMPYSVPDGYFETITQKRVAEKNKPATRVISLHQRKWFRYAAAAVVAGLIAVTALLVFNKREKSEIILAKVKKDVKKMDESQKENLIDFIDAGMTGEETAQVNTQPKSNEVKELLKGVSEEELKDFQEQTEDLEGVIMTD